MTRFAMLAAAPVLLAAPATAQTMDHGGHGGAQPSRSARAQLNGPTTSAQSQGAATTTSDPHAGHDMAPGPSTDAPAPEPGATPAADAQDVTEATGQAEHDMSAMAMPEPAATVGEQDQAQPSGVASIGDLQTAAPAAPTDRLADRYYGAAEMARARATLQTEHGGSLYSKFMASLLEVAPNDGGGYRWDLQGWYGGDINRLVVSTEGEGGSEGVDDAELQLLYARAVGRYTFVRAGVKQDFEPSGRTYLTAGFDTLFPYWFEIEAAAFLSTDGDLLVRAAGTYDLRLTQRLVLQPQAELNFAAQNNPETRTGSGLNSVELGLRLRYEFRREFAPYVGLSYDRRFGRTADYIRAEGGEVGETRFVFGLRAWF